MFRLPQRGRQPAPDDPITVDPFYRRLVPAPKFIRITGAQRVIVSSDIMTTYYSWTAVYHPTDTTELGSRPRDVYPRDFGGPKNDSRIPIPPESEDSADPTVTPWPAIEASGNDSVPTDGSVIVPDAESAPDGTVLCRAYEHDGKCNGCRACYSKGVSVIAYPAHGKKMAKVIKINKK